jgi:ribosomal protein S18 acetylase RimI-like enzyme
VQPTGFLADVPDLVSARAATPADTMVTSALAQQAMVTVRDERGGRWHLDHDRDKTDPQARHTQAVEAADQQLVVGCIEGVVVGYGLAYLSPTTDGQLCMIDELVVHPRAQAIGVGSEILAHVRSWAVDRNCQAIESQVLPGNRAAKNFFERVGMKTRKMRVSADL